MRSDKFSPTSSYHTAIHPLSDADQPGLDWHDLEQRGSPSFFQTWCWTSAFRALASEFSPPLLVRVEHSNELVGLAVVYSRTSRRLGVITSRALLMGECGDRSVDRLTVEHNGFLFADSISSGALSSAFAGLVHCSSDWDELIISGLEHRRYQEYAAIAKNFGLTPSFRIGKPYFYVDLSRLRETGVPYLASLSRNTRYQIRRAMKAYSQRGPLSYTVARNLDECFAWFEQLSDYHQQYWRGRGEAGAFGSEKTRRFHELLISDAFPKGQIELARINAGDSTIGFLYNFISAGVVANYQAGLVYEEDGHLKPGLVAHSLAIERAISEGHRIYDFLMGESRYKRNLSTSEGTMVWATFQRPRFRFTVERTLDLLGTQASKIQGVKKVLALLRSRR